MRTGRHKITRGKHKRALPLLLGALMLLPPVPAFPFQAAAAGAALAICAVKRRALL